YKKFNEYNIDVMNLQKRSLETKYRMYRDEFERVKALETENEQALKKSQNLGDSELELAQKDAIKQMIAERNREIQHLIVNAIGQNEYHELTRFDETVAKINQQITDLDSKTRNVSSLSDKVFEKNTAALGHFGVRALKHQLDLKQKSKVAENEVKERTKKVLDLEKRYQESTDVNERNKINSEIIKEKDKLRNWVGVKDYSDIDVKEKPLYVAPENMLPGMGSLTPLEEYKGMIRIGWDNFAKKITSNDPEYKKLRENYEKETGIKITEKNALEVAKKHIAGTFDNAHLGAWLKHFRKIEGEDEEHRIQEFNKWINSQAEDMAKEGIIRHIHLNDTKGKDDDHNLLGQGILDIHDLRERLRKAGIDEPFIVEAGGRGAASNMHILNAFEVFNPALTKDGVSENGIDYKVRSQENGSGVSDWVSVQRDYVRRPQYSTYGMSYNTFRAAPPQDGAKKGDWSGLGFF
ncbi:MAG: TIM barrel protein, partial [Nanoarchaeota archaeon]